jgi:hypothetical protein
MHNIVGLENILRAELTLLSKQILQDVNQKDFNELFRSVKELHEKMAAIKVLSEQLTDAELVDVFQKNSIKTEVKERNEKLEDVKNTPEIVKEDIKHETEKKESKNTKTTDKVDEIFKEMANISFVKKKKSGTANSTEKEIEKPLLNKDESLSTSSKNIKEISIGLNDRISFINYLFEGDSEAFNETVNKLNACDSYGKALGVIYNDVKPKYNNWDGKDQYEFRFLQLLELKFN